MSHVFKDHIKNYSCLQEFQEKSVRFLNELFGRQEPLEIFDFTINEVEGQYAAIGYREGEKIPEEQKPGEAVSEEIKEIQASAEIYEMKAPEKDKAKYGKKHK